MRQSPAVTVVALTLIKTSFSFGIGLETSSICSTSGVPYWYEQPESQDDPVVGVTWEQANAYCQLSEQDQVGKPGSIWLNSLSDQFAISFNRVVVGQSQGPIHHLAFNEFAQGLVEEALQPPQTYTYAQDSQPL